MRRASRTILATLVPVAAYALAVAGPARAGERFTSWGPVGTGEFIVCHVVNVSDITRTVKIEIRDGGGNAIPDASCIDDNPRTVSLPAGKTDFHSCSSTGTRYCHFTVVGTASSAIRGSLEILKNNLDRVVVIPAE